MTAIAFHYAKGAGRFHTSSVFVTAVSVNAYQSGPMVWGGVSIVNDHLYISTQAASVVVGTAVVDGKTVPHALVTSRSFLYGPVLCHAVVELTAYTTWGEVGYKILRNSDGAMMDETAPAGVYCQMPLEYGSVSIL